RDSSGTNVDIVLNEICWLFVSSGNPHVNAVILKNLSSYAHLSGQEYCRHLLERNILTYQTFSMLSSSFQSGLREISPFRHQSEENYAAFAREMETNLYVALSSWVNSLILTIGVLALLTFATVCGRIERDKALFASASLLVMWMYYGVMSVVSLHLA